MATASKSQDSGLVPFDWTELGTLRLRARAVADGLYAGAHASRRKGSGVEFGGHRAYVPGDDLRLLDRRAMARHDKPYIRELQTETDRGLYLVVDASASMGFRGRSSQVTKLGYATTIAAALARVALSSGDPVGFTAIGGKDVRPVPPSSGREAFERVLGALSNLAADGVVKDDVDAIDRALAPVARRARRGAVIVLLSDLVDLHPLALRRFSALASGGRTLVALRVLDPEEATFPFEGPVRLRAVEGSYEVETNPETVRAGYLAALAAVASSWSKALGGHGGRVVLASTADHPVTTARAVVRAAAGGAGAREDRAP